MFQDRPAPTRFSRSQRFSLSEAGKQAEQQYRETIVASRTTAGRDSFDSARDAWAKSLGIEADDGLYLSELASGPKTSQQLVDALETCGKGRDDAKGVIARIFKAQLIVADEMPAKR